LGAEKNTSGLEVWLSGRASALKTPNPKKKKKKKKKKRTHHLSEWRRKRGIW
jgi:hypothetical protein